MALDCEARYRWLASVLLSDLTAVTLHSDPGNFATHRCTRGFIAVGGTRQFCRVQ
jgi:hypothetical protein